MIPRGDFSRLHQLGDEIGLDDQNISSLAIGNLLVDNGGCTKDELDLISRLPVERLGDLLKGGSQRPVAYDFDLRLG